MLDFEVFRKVIDEAGPTLARVDFFNYGEAFLHKRAVEMCEYIKTHYPHIYLYTSTNGLAFTEDARAAPGPHRHRRSDVLDRRRVAGELRPLPPARRLREGDPQPAASRPTRSGAAGSSCRSSTGATSSSTGTTAKRRCAARASMAGELGVDRLCWEITDHPEEAFSRRFAPGSGDHAAIRHEIWDDNNLGNAIPGARRARGSSCAASIPTAARRNRRAARIRWSRCAAATARSRSAPGPAARSPCKPASAT